MDSAWLAVGLGNPGRRYEPTRHNAGYRAAEHLAQTLAVTLRPAKAPALVADAMTKDVRLLIVQPTTFMNESGRAVGPLSRWYRIPPERIIVLHDEIDIGSGVIRLKQGGGTAGHHGLDSIVESLGTKEFFRVRIGVGRPTRSGMDAVDHVLAKMTKAELAELAEAEAAAGEAALAIIHDGFESAKSRFNSPRR